MQRMKVRGRRFLVRQLPPLCIQRKQYISNFPALLRNHSFQVNHTPSSALRFDLELNSNSLTWKKCIALCQPAGLPSSLPLAPAQLACAGRPPATCNSQPLAFSLYAVSEECHQLI